MLRKTLVARRLRLSWALASMRPQRNAAENTVATREEILELVGFNEAAA